jgi:sugar lactone lactonase YvrE
MAHTFSGNARHFIWFPRKPGLHYRLLALFILLLAYCPAVLSQSPRIDSIDPSQGPIAGGTVVTIRGANFQDASLGIDNVTIIPQSLATSKIRFITPQHDNGIVTIKVASTAGVAYTEFLYVPPKLKDLPAGYITTVAGIGMFKGYYRPATKASVAPAGAAFDQKGNLYIAEPGQSRVSRVNLDGILEPFAGSGYPPYDRPDIGDGGPAIEAKIGYPRGVTTDAEGNVYIAEEYHRVRRVDTHTGIITTIAGNGTRGFSGDGGPATLAHLNNVAHITGDGKGTIFIIDFDDILGTGAARIRKITPEGIISTVAGIGVTGFSGDGGPATEAQFNLVAADCGALTVDSAGNIYVADTGNNRIRRIDGQTGIITTFAGPTSHLGEPIMWPRSVAVDSGDNVYYWYGANPSRILKISPLGQLLAVYGTGKGFSEDGTPVADVSLSSLILDLAIDSEGNVVYTDGTFFRVRRLNFATGKLETLAGCGPHPIGESGPAVAAVFGSGVGDLAFLQNGELLIGDFANFLLRKLDHQGNISTIAGPSNDILPHGDDQPALGAYVAPVGVKIDAVGRIYIADTSIIRRIDSDGIIRRVAGYQHGILPGFSGDGGPALDAELCQPWDIAFDKAWNLFIADTNNNRIRRVDAQTGIITTVAGSGPVNGNEGYGRGSYCGDGSPATEACLNTPYGITVDSASNLFIADNGNGRIRKVDSNGIITTFARLGYPSKLVFDSAGNLYAADHLNINRINRSGVVIPLAGEGDGGFSGDGGPAIQAKTLANGSMVGIAIDAEGNLFFSDSGNNRVRAIRYGALIAPPGAQIQSIRGASQSAPATAAFTVPLEVLVLDSSGQPAAGVRVEFSSPTSGASCMFTNGTTFIAVITDHTGHASAACTANAQDGTYNVAAAPLAVTAAIQFSLTNTPRLVSKNLALAAGGAATSSTIESAGSAQAGYARVAVNAGSNPYGTAVFSFKQSGVTVSETGVPASPPTTSARIFIDYRSNIPAVPGRSEAGTINVNTGIAVVNYSFSTANVTYTLRDFKGEILSSGHGTIGAGNHFACFIDQLKASAAPDFSFPPDFQSITQFGSLEISSDQLLSVLALRGTNNQRNDFLITTTPIADLTLPLSTSSIYFPQFVDGGGYTTSLILMNTSDTAESGSFQIMDGNGEPQVVNQAGGSAGSSFNYSIQPGGVFHFQTDGFPQDTKAGWVRLIADSGTSAPVGSGVFGYNPGNVLVSESGIPSAAATMHARVYVDLSSNHNTGLAMANVTDAGASIVMNAFKNDGTTVAGTSQGSIPLPANGYRAAFADQFIADLPEGFTGVLDISSATPFAALTLRSLVNERDDFLMTTFPVADANRAAPSPIVFPHIVDGGGYVTHFILIGAGSASSTTFSFYDEDGAPLAIGK